ncbi:MAG TPA: 5'-methylthioadenosine/adenosylhomocysteine nucleosidase [Trueperaceae bacterium]
MTGIIGAMPEELEELLAILESREDLCLTGLEVCRGRLEGEPVLLARCGIGKVNAAALTQLLIGQGAQRIIFTGVAGALAPGLGIGDIVIGTDAIQHDLDVTALGYAPGQVPGEPFSWPSDPELVALARRAAEGRKGARVILGRIASGDQFIASPERARALHERFGATCAEMEGAAVAQVCNRAQVPFVIIRSISDSADGAAELNFREFTPLAARRAKSLVREMCRRLPGPTHLN